ncbi:MAG: biopolymer transporter ExbD [Deltaproteobacteria bacterium]|nr:biopolymer transporter ExbD [Deltaproteobacteria bacterium]
MDTEQPKKVPPPPSVDIEAMKRADRRAIMRLRRGHSTDDVEFLNITAMMDMMTILLVFMLVDFTSKTQNVQMSDQLALPSSATAVKVAESVSVTITKSSLLVDGEPVAGVKRGAVDAADKQGGDTNSLIIRPLLASLEGRAKYYKLLAKTKNQPFEGALTIIADKGTPYRLLTEVLYTAGQEEVGYKLYRLIVLEKAR